MHGHVISNATDGPRKWSVGLSLLELIFMIATLGILAVTVLNKMFAPGGMTIATQAQAAADLVRRAQALALTHGRQTRVSASTTAPTTTLLLEVCATPTSCTTQASYSTDQAVTISGLATPIRFNSLGQPLTAGGTVSAVDVGFNLIVTSQEPKVDEPDRGTVQAVDFAFRVNVSALTGRVDAYRP